MSTARFVIMVALIGVLLVGATVMAVISTSSNSNGNDIIILLASNSQTDVQKAETELTRMGDNAKNILEKAIRSDDERLSKRAKKVFDALFSKVAP